MKILARRLFLVVFGLILLSIPAWVYLLESWFEKRETKYEFLWMQPTVFGFDSFATATYKDGVLYAPSKGDDRLYAINALNGDVIWNTTVRDCDSSPCIDGRVVYVGESSRSSGVVLPRALAINMTTGMIIWQFTGSDDSGTQWVGSPLVQGDYVYYTTYGKGVYALNKTNGDILWHQRIGRLVCSAAYHDGVVFVSSYIPPGQYALNATTGEEIWHVDYGKSWDSSPVLYDGMVIQVAFETIGKQEFRLTLYSTYVLNETNGELLRKFDEKGSPSTPLVYGGKIFIPDDDYRIWAFDLITGQELWHTEQLHNGTFQDLSYCSPAASGGAIYYQSLNGTFYVVNETDGKILWSHTLGGLGIGSPSIGDGCVFITNDHALYAFRIGHGIGDWPMFCQNEFHRSFSEHGIEHIECPLRP